MNTDGNAGLLETEAEPQQVVGAVMELIYVPAALRSTDIPRRVADALFTNLRVPIHHSTQPPPRHPFIKPRRACISS